MKIKIISITLLVMISFIFISGCTTTQVTTQSDFFTKDNKTNNALTCDVNTPKSGNTSFGCTTNFDFVASLSKYIQDQNITITINGGNK